MKFSPFPAFVLLFALSLAACGGNSSAKEKASGDTADASAFSEEQISAQEKAWDKVMAIHDEVMPRMGTIHKLTKTLKEQWEKNEALDASTKDDISIAIQELETADEGMWDWMHNLKQLEPLQRSEPHEAIMKYLSEQEQSMILVREEMDNSMEKADSILKALGLPDLVQ